MLDITSFHFSLEDFQVSQSNKDRNSRTNSFDAVVVKDAANPWS